jgi:hypothetical protein
MTPDIFGTLFERSLDPAASVPLGAHCVKNSREKYWLFKRSTGEMKRVIGRLLRTIATPGIVPDRNLIAIARSDDTTFGILHSRFHELWSLRLCTFQETQCKPLIP